MVSMQTPATITVSSPICSTPTYTLDSFQECYCDCYEVDINPVALQEKIENIQSNLTVDVQTLSSTRREKTSATDTRPSAISVGLFAIIVIITVISVIIFQDVVAAALFIMQAVKRKIRTGTFTKPKTSRRKRIKTNNMNKTGPSTMHGSDLIPNIKLHDVENPAIQEVSTFNISPNLLAVNSVAQKTTAPPNIPPRRKATGTIHSKSLISSMENKGATPSVTKSKPVAKATKAKITPLMKGSGVSGASLTTTTRGINRPTITKIGVNQVSHKT